MALNNRSQHLYKLAYFEFSDVRVVSNSSVRASTASRNALPGLKWRTRFSGMATLSPERGFLPMRGERRFTEKLPKPRISTLCPRTRASLNASRIVLTAYSASRCVNWPKRTANCSTRSLLVIKRGTAKWRAKVVRECDPARHWAGGPFISRRCPSWRAAMHPDLSGQNFHGLTAG